MSGFFNKLKQTFSSKPPPPKFRSYTATELKVIAMKTRLILQKNMEEIKQTITKEDQLFRYAGQDRQKVYNILQSIGQKVIEAESLKILIEMVRKIQNHSHQIVQANGDVSKLKTQIQWFQMVLWYRRSREVTTLEDLFSFCYNFFKGVDITIEINVTCDVFQFYPIMKYLPKKEGFPLQDIIPYIQPYIKYKIDPSIAEGIASFFYNSQQYNPQGQSQVNPGPVPHSNVYPNASQMQNNPHSNPSHLNPYQSNTFNINQQNINNNPYESRMNDPRGNPHQPYNSNPYANNNNYGGNSNINPNQPYNSYYKPNVKPIVNPNNSQYNQPQPNNFPSIDQSNNEHINPQHSNPYEINPNPYESGQSKKQEDVGYPDIDDTLNDLDQWEKKEKEEKEEKERREREKAERIAQQQQEARRAKEEKQKREREEAQRIAIKLEEERRAREEEKRVKEEEQRKRREEQLLKLELQKLRIQKEKAEKQKQEEQNKLIEELKKQNQLQKQNNELDVDNQLDLDNQLDEQLDFDDEELLREAEQRFGLEDEQNKEIEKEEVELREEIAENQRQRSIEEEREEIERELDNEREVDDQREIDLGINVFADDQRQAVDRGISGRFSQNFGMKVDFGDNMQGQDFNYQSSSDIKSSMLNFKSSSIKKQESQLPSFLPQPEQPQQNTEHEQPQQNTAQADESQSLGIINEHKNCEPSTDFKLFYFKRTQ